MSDPAPDMDRLLAALREDARLGPELVHEAWFPPVEAQWGVPAAPLPAPLAAALAQTGVHQLYHHQAAGLDAVARGDNVLVTTPTASGKSAIFHLPPLLAALAGEGGHGLFLFPLKALGQDQCKKFNALAAAAGLDPAAAHAEIYDGDTAQAARARIRRRPPRVLITNPDMLHLGMLGSWTSWQPLLANLRWIVLDELHVYRGIFGSHFHHVLHRLLRLAAEQGARPVVIAASATAENAAEFASTLTGLPMTVLGESGAPRPGRHVLLYRPDASPYSTALHLLAALLKSGRKTIAFTKARRITELLYSWLRRSEPELAKRVASYRSGFLPEERRAIERRLFTGELDGVIATSALELGIDVGGLDASVLVGYPGSVMATWQRSGRAGRGGRASLTALVALPDALDQYFLDHPEQLLSRPCERLIVDPGNEPVARAHLVCAAAELALSPERDGGPGGYLERHPGLVQELVEFGALAAIKRPGRPDEYASLARRPHRHVNLRGSGSGFDIVDRTSGEMIGSLDGIRAYHEGHPGAVYLHGGRQYQVASLDLDNRHVVVEEADVDFFTTPLTEKETAILEVLGERREGPLVAFLGRLRVTERVVGFERKRVQDQTVLGQERLELPPSSFETVGWWYVAPQPFEDALREAAEHFMGALHASEHAAISLVPLAALCDRGDVGGISYPLHPQVGCGAVFVYDGHPGGVGIAARVFSELPLLLGRVRDLIAACPCDAGCPSCIQSPKCGNGNRPLDKAGAVRVLRLLLGELPVPGEVEVPPPRLDLPAGPGPAPREEVAEEPQPAPGVPALPPASQKAAGLRTVLFDLETRRSAEEVGGWHRAHRMGIAVGVVCVLEEGRFEVFHEHQVAELVALLASADLVVGYNSRAFDYAVLSGYTGVDHNRQLPTLDLLEDLTRRLGHRVSLNDVAGATLGAKKSGDGLQSLAWVREGRLDLVEAYCRRDVELLRDVYLFGRREGFVRYQRRQGGVHEVAVEW